MAAPTGAVVYFIFHCHLDNGSVTNIANVTSRDTAKAINYGLNADKPSAAPVGLMQKRLFKMQQR